MTTEPFPTFDEASRLERRDDTTFRALLPGEWRQGRGAFGGLVVGVLLRAIEETAAEPDRPIRAATAEIPSPVLPGPAEVRVSLVRRGSGVSSYEARIVQEGETRARASAVLGKTRDVGLSLGSPPPVIGDPDAARPIPIGKLPPPFTRAFDFRNVGPLPFASGDDARVEGFIHMATTRATWDVPQLAGLIDAYWPTFFSVTDGPRPGGTVTFPLHLTAAARGLSTERPLFYRARALTLTEGFLCELRELWTLEGELVALNPQTFAVIA